jgi:hypothetical protein
MNLENETCLAGLPAEGGQAGMEYVLWKMKIFFN